MKRTRFGKAFAEARARGDRFFKFGKKEYHTGLKGESGKQTVKALEKNYEKVTGVPRKVTPMKSLEANRAETALMPSRGVTPIEREGKRKGLGGLVDRIRYNRMKRAERRAEGKPEVSGVNPPKATNTATPKKEPVFVTAMANIKAKEDERKSRKPGLVGRMIENAKARRADRLAERAKREDAKASGIKVTENTGDFIRGMGKGNATDMLRQAIANRANAKPTAGPTKEGPSATKAVAEANAASNQKPAETKSSPASNFVTGAGPGNARTALQQQLSTAVSTESLEDKAKRVIRGDYGVGAARKAKLGSDYEAVQGEVNKMMKSKKKLMGGGMVKKYAKGGKIEEEGMKPKGKMDKKKAFLEMIARLKAKKK